MKKPTARRAGSALAWKAVELGGTKAVFLLRLVVLARILTPDDFGLLAIATVAIGVSSRLTDLGMVPALVQTDRPRPALYDVAWTVGIVRGALIGGLVYVVAEPVAVLFKDPRAADLMRLLALQPLLEALISIRVVDFIRELNFRSVALIRLPSAVANTVVAIALAPSLGVWALVAGALAGPAATLVASYLVAPYRPRLLFETQAARSLIRFGRWIFLAGVAALASDTILRLVVSRQLGTEELGLYYLAASLAFLPSELMSSLVGDITFPMYSRLQSTRRTLSGAFRSVLTGTSTLMIPGCLLLIVLSPALVEHVLGDKWQGTVPIIQIIGAVNLVGLLGDNVTPILKGVGRPDRVVVLEVVQSVLLIALVWILTPKWGVRGAAFAWIPAVAMSQILSIAYVRDVLPHPFAGLRRRLLPVISVSAVAAATSVWLVSIVPSMAGLVLAVLVSSALVVVSLAALDRRFELGVVEDLGKAFPQAASILGLVPSTKGK